MALPLSTWAQGDRPPPGGSRALSVPRAAVAPVIDGKLDEEVWKTAPVANGFWISEQGRWPTEKTEVLVVADAEHLYFGFRSYDRQPEGISAIQTRRDAGLGFDDQVVVDLDPYHDHRTVSSYYVNANGAQSDAIAGGRARKIEWKGDWRAAVARTDYGWSVEIAIPFSILNYRAGDRVFGVNFARHQNRTGEWSRWADWTPQSKKEEMGHLTGLELPTVANVRPFTFMPYLLGGHNVPNKEGHVRDFLATAGIDIRYEPRPNLTGVLSVNPDFSQLETQVTSIDFNYNEKFRSDPRPFFQEGSAYFGGDTLYFYSSRVPDFDAGAKLFTTVGRFSVGTFLAYAPHDRLDGVFRLGYELDPTHSASLMFVATDRDDLRNGLLVGQFVGRQATGVNYRLDLAHTNTEKQPDGDGGTVRGTLGWAGDYLSVTTAADYYDQGFFPADGLQSQDLVGTKGGSVTVNYYREPPDGPFHNINAYVGGAGRDTVGGLKQARNWYAGASGELRQEIRIRVDYFDGVYRPVGATRGAFSDTLNSDHYWTVGVDLFTRSSRFGLGASYAWGALGGGDYGYLSAYVFVRPTDNTFVNVTTERLDSFGVFDQTIVSAGWDITVRDSLVTRYILADGKQSFRLAYRRQVRAGVDVYAVYDDEPGKAEQASVKLVWTFR